jgi:hypothetical protein
MENVQGQEVSRHAIAAYTESARIAGELVSPGRRRLLDILNLGSETFLEIKEATISLTDMQRGSQVVRRDSIIINRDELIMVFPLQETVSGSPEMKIRKVPYPAIIYTSTYLVRGNFHKIELLNLQDYLSQQDERYVALTDASAVSIAQPGTKPISQDVILLNKRKIVALHSP